MKSGKKLFYSVTCFLLAMIVAVTCCACGDSPEAAVKGYLNALKNFDLEGIAKYSETYGSNTDELADLTDYLDDSEEVAAIFEYVKKNLKKMSYSIVDSEIDGDQAVVTAKIKYIDITEPVTEALTSYVGNAFISIFSGSTDEEPQQQALQEALEEAFKNADDTYTTTEIEFLVFKTDSGWKIDNTPIGLTKILIGNLGDTLSSLGY